MNSCISLAESKVRASILSLIREEKLYHLATTLSQTLPLSPSLFFFPLLSSHLPSLPFLIPFHPTILLHSLSDMITTSGGKKIHPVTIEESIKSEIPFLSNVMVVGDKREYLTCLMTLKVYLYPSLSSSLSGSSLGL